MVHFSELPTEILFNIFFVFVPAQSWPALAVVCSWSEFIIKKCWEKVQRLSFEDLPLIRSKSFQVLCRNFVDLKAVELNGVYLTCADIQKLPIGLESLKIFNADKMLKEKTKVFSVFYRFVYLKILKISTLEGCPFIVNFNQVSEYFRNCALEVLELQKVHLVDRNASRVLEYPKELRVLKILNSLPANLPENLIKMQIWKLKSERSLGLNHETLTNISQNCKSLQSLMIIDSTNDNISNTSFQILINSCRSLTKIKLCRQRNLPIKTVNDFSAMLLSTQTSRLVSLNLDSFQKISDAGIIEILKSNPQISNLSLSYTFITDDSLLAISNLKLKKLVLRSCKRISSSGLSRLFTVLTQLQCLNLAHAHGVTDEVLETIELNCKNIQRLVIREPDLSDNFKFNSSELTHLKSLTIDFCCFSNFSLSVGNIEELSIIACKGLGDCELNEICEKFSKLKKLNIRLCTQVSEYGVIQICKKMKGLRYLDIRGLKLSTGFMGYLPLMWKNLAMIKTGILCKCEETHQEAIKDKFKVLVELDGRCSYLKFEP